MYFTNFANIGIWKTYNVTRTTAIFLQTEAVATFEGLLQLRLMRRERLTHLHHLLLKRVDGVHHLRIRQQQRPEHGAAFF